MSSKPFKRRWYQFSLRALLLFFVLVSAVLAFWTAQIRPYRNINATYDRLNGRGAVQPGNIDQVELSWYQRPLLRSGWYGKCGYLWFRSEPSAADFDDLRSVTKEELEVMVDCPLSDDAAKMLATLDIAALQVDLKGNLTHTGWEMLKGKPIRALAVRTWHGDANQFSGRELALLSEFPKLDTLAFHASTLTDQDFGFLKPIPSLSTVVLSASISDKSLAFLAGAKLKSLAVAGDSANPVTGSGLNDIADVQRLSLDTRALTDASLARIARWPSLRALGLDWAKAITPDGLRSLAGAQRLETLRLDFANITDEDLPILAGCKNLKRLSLRGTKVTGVGLASLSNLPLEDLDLFECKLSDEAPSTIAKMPGSFSVNTPEWSDDKGYKGPDLAKFRETLGNRAYQEIDPRW